MSGSLQSTKIILLADDDEDDRQFFRDALREVSDAIRLEVAGNGIELIERLNRQMGSRPYLVFLDLNMPRKNGYECLAEIRKQGKFKGLPVVVISTSIQQDAVERVYRLGASLYIVKPNDYRQLKKIIDEVLGMFADNVFIRPAKEKFIVQA
jgi:CheY-like chemotaxis protein